MSSFNIDRQTFHDAVLAALNRYPESEKGIAFLVAAIGPTSPMIQSDIDWALQALTTN